MFVSQILFQFKNGERFTGVVELRCNGCAGTMTGNLSPTVLLRETRLPAQKRDRHLIDIPIPNALASVGKEKLYQLPVFASISRSCSFGRICSHSWMRLPTSGCTGLVYAVEVLFTGISRKQVASLGKISPVSGTMTSSYCQRTHPTCKRRISLLRSAAKHHTTATARTNSSG